MGNLISFNDSNENNSVKKFENTNEIRHLRADNEEEITTNISGYVEISETEQLSNQDKNNLNEENKSIEIENNLAVESNKNIESDLSKYATILKNNNFFIQNNKLCCYRNGMKIISNFIPIITEKRILTDGLIKDTRYKVKAIILENGKELTELEISKKEFDSFRFIIGSDWDFEAIIEGNEYSNLKMVAQILSKSTCKIIKTYTKTGFERHPETNKLLYLYHGGVLGDTNNDIIECDLPKQLKMYSYTNEEFSKEEALKTSYSILKMGKKEIMIPLLGYIYISPLISVFSDDEIGNFVLFFVGTTGTGKSTTAAIGCSHFGNFTTKKFGVSLTDTINRFQRVAYYLADTMVVIDDLNHQKSKDKENFVNDILGFFGDRQGRGRLNSNCEIKDTFYPRGTGIVTAEYMPNLPEGRIARSIIIKFTSSSLDIKKVKEIEKKKALLAFCMKLYIMWIIENEERIKKEFNIFPKKIEEVENNSFHGRTKEAISTLNFGFHLFLKFLNENGIINSEEMLKLESEAKDVLVETAYKQKYRIEENNPITMFYTAIEELLSTKKIVLLDYNNDCDIKQESSGKIVGFIDNKEGYYYFYPVTIYAEIKNFYSKTETPFSVSRKELWDLFEEKELLYLTSKQRKTIERTDKRTGAGKTVIAIKIKNDTGSLDNNINKGNEFDLS